MNDGLRHSVVYKYDWSGVYCDKHAITTVCSKSPAKIGELPSSPNIELKRTERPAGQTAGQTSGPASECTCGQPARRTDRRPVRLTCDLQHQLLVLFADCVRVLAQLPLELRRQAELHGDSRQLLGVCGGRG